MQSLTDIGVVREVLSRHGFTFSKALGQNFLVNPTVCPQMAESCGADGQGVLEIGPGIGVLTAEPVGLLDYTSEFTIDWRGMCALAVIMIIPAVISIHILFTTSLDTFG